MYSSSTLSTDAGCIMLDRLRTKKWLIVLLKCENQMARHISTCQGFSISKDIWVRALSGKQKSSHEIKQFIPFFRVYPSIGIPTTQHIKAKVDAVADLGFLRGGRFSKEGGDNRKKSFFKVIRGSMNLIFRSFLLGKTENFSRREGRSPPCPPKSATG
jgi:hypothetical protein